MTQTVIIDLALAGILVLAAVVGAKQGLLKSLAGILVLVLAIAGASVSARVAAPIVTDLVAPAVTAGVKDMVISALEKELLDSDALAQFGELGSQLTGSVDEMLGQMLEGDLLEKLPPEEAEKVKALFGKLGLDEEDLEDIAGAAGAAGAGAGSEAAWAADPSAAGSSSAAGSAASSAEKENAKTAGTVEVLVRKVIESVVSVGVFLLVFVILLAVLKIAVKALDLVVTLPGLRVLNGLGGAAVSVVEWALVLSLLAWAAGRMGKDLTPYVEGTKLASLLVELTPAQLFSKLF